MIFETGDFGENIYREKEVHVGERRGVLEDWDGREAVGDKLKSIGTLLFFFFLFCIFNIFGFIST